jgi:hypothetical protein
MAPYFTFVRDILLPGILIVILILAVEYLKA